jgi:hypothetical protein
MKKYVTITLFCIAVFNFVSIAQESENYAVPIVASSNSSGKTVLEFKSDNWGTTYRIFRMVKGGNSWGAQPVVSFNNVDSSAWISWTDENTSEGSQYEYRVVKSGVQNFIGNGYILTGSKIPAVHKKGKMLMIVEPSLLGSMSEDINKHALDIAADGWEVMIKSPAQNTVPMVRKLIDDLMNEHGKFESIYLFGHVAVPYSGIYCEHPIYTVPPDGHGPGQGNHCGAWPADVYYAIHDATWTDSDSVVNNVAREANKNRPNDGKFDEIFLPGTVESQIGRVDLSNLPNFPQTETELMQRYIQKNHDYRYGISKTVDSGLVDENFPASYGAFSSTAWRNFPSLLGKNRTENKDYITTLKNSPYLWAYGTGAGSDTSCNKVAGSFQMVTENTAIFNLLFGSYFGDWNTKNNFLRSVLGSPKGGLTNAWSGRPWWHVHPMGLGESIGYSARITQNSKDLYAPAVFENGIHIALMGDPSLRMYYFKGAENLSLQANTERNQVDISWTASNSQGVIGYHVYYSWNPSGPYTKINHDLLTTTSLSHMPPYDGKVYYMVRAERLEITPSGSFYNLSPGLMGMIDNIDAVGVDDLAQRLSAKVFPNPASDFLTIETEVIGYANITYQITDLVGKEVLHGSIEANGLSRSRIDLAGLSNGSYHLKLGNQVFKLQILH